VKAEIDFKTLVPGGRLRIRDWRDQSFIDATFFAFKATRTLPGPPRIYAGQHFTELRNNRQVIDTVLVVQRDFACGLTWLSHRDVAELLPFGSDYERYNRLASLVTDEARDCAACKEFTETLKEPDKGKHKRGGWGGSSYVGHAVIPEIMKLLMSLRPVKSPKTPDKTEKPQTQSEESPTSRVLKAEWWELWWVKPGSRPCFIPAYGEAVSEWIPDRCYPTRKDALDQKKKRGNRYDRVVHVKRYRRSSQ